jgi:hypothetical protein
LIMNDEGYLSMAEEGYCRLSIKLIFT